MSSANTRTKSQPNSHFLPPIETRITKNRRPRPPVGEQWEAAARIPLRAPSPVKQRKTGLRRMFRSKPEKESNESCLVSPALESPLHPFSFQLSTSSSLNSPAIPDLFQGRTKSEPLDLETPTQDVTPKTKTNKERKKGSFPTKASKLSTSISQNACDPLPLFRAYPQSIKHAKLASPNLAADSIIRNSNHKRNTSAGEDIPQVTQTEGEKVDKKTKARGVEKGRKHKRHLSGSISKAEWQTIKSLPPTILTLCTVDKIYVLTTSGFLLQYLGEGPFDRLPEKILQLSKESVVFASDAIPGKHWVLQISQALGSDGQTPVGDPRSILSRLSFRGTEYRRTTTSLLLILESAEEMDFWISAVRREIEALGGKKHLSETGSPEDVEQPKVLNTPTRFSTFVFPKVDESVDSCSSESERQFKDALVNSTTTRPLSTIRPSIDCPSISTSTTSKDEACLESLRGSSNHRLSYLSSGPPTIATTPDSSPLPSPTREKMFPSSDRLSVDRPYDHRRSIQTLENHIIGQLGAPGHRPQSTMAQSAYTPQDFSTIPSSRFLIRSTSNAEKAETFRSFGNLSSRKRTPPTLSSERPLSPIEDSTSPNAVESHSSPRSDFSYSSQQNETRPRTSSAATSTASTRTFPRRYSSLAPLPSLGLEHKTPPARPAPYPPHYNIPLPALPPGRLLDPRSASNIQDSTAQTKGMRRPASMQIRTNAPPRPPVSLRMPISPRRTEAVIPPPSPVRLFAPMSPVYKGTASRPKSAQAKPSLQNRRSMPHFAINGPPSLPPPACALPPLPSGIGV